MREVGRVVRGDWSYPVILDDEGYYHVDLGGAYGVSDPFEFDSDEEAVSFFTKALEEEDY